VAYKYQLLATASGVDSATNEEVRILHSTSNRVASLFPDTARMGLAQSREVDSNYDGLVDSIELNLQLPVQRTEQIREFSMLALFETTLSNRVRMVFEAAAFVQSSGGVPGAGVTVDGDLELRQTYPLYARGGYSTPYADDPLLDEQNIVDAVEASIPRILEAYAARNVTQVFRPSYLVWHPTTEAQPANAGPGGAGARVFNVTATVRVPIERVSYTPQISEVLLDGWVKYFAMLVVVGYVLNKLLSFIYFNQLMETRVFVDNPSGVALKKLHGM